MPLELQPVWYVLAGVLILIGVAGVILPALPGLPLVFVGMLLAAWAGNFEQIGWVTLTLLGLLTLLSLAVDVFSTAIGAQRVGASRKALLGSVLGSLIGLFFMPIGLLVGPFVGALAGELWHSREWRKATKVGFGTWLGIVIGVVLKLGLTFAMLGLFVFAWLV
ncbi:hypothetical protein CSC70_08255 [Pseudoxanthomonas kalamensis DSM 18571]|uniref:DUF456 domain-containing protein n=1 Tax=Pseudoxanthomonas kalamensis TaxID=289483 RepID=UPI0013910F23|nr:DUF456 domain-containing protein [Pseudoxanthomonas kalamensis]KAF1710634.1 hypothetical protein CSC70_08255 [Pseudoxanthomonas kalamensis DSM 18571]